MADGNGWRQDRVLWGALIVGLVLRLLPMILFMQGDCVRDECIYRSLGANILEGEGLTTTAKGWLPAPGFPFLLAAFKFVFGAFFAVKFLHIGLGVLTIGILYALGKELQGLKVARIAAWLYAVHPTLVFFTQTMWIETIYIFFLLLAVLGILMSRRLGWRRAAWAGAALGAATLFKGVATYLAPIFALAAMWPDGGGGPGAIWPSLKRRWRAGLALFLGWAVMVAPWSAYSSAKYGGFTVSDATVGHVLFLGNNDFPPLTFDYGNGMLTGPIYARYLRAGRRPCNRNEPPVKSSKCDVAAAVEWARNNPDTFVERIPMRMAQMFNPHSFFTRHLRWGYWLGIPWWMKEGLVLYTALTSVFLMVVGTVAAFAKARGPYGMMAVGTVAYTLGTVAVSYGMTRFRLPLEPFWLLFAALLLAAPRETLAELGRSTARSAATVLTLPILLVLMAWYLPTGWPMFW